MENILNNIKQIRLERGYSQEFMASQLKIEQTGYSYIETGRRKLKYETLEQIAIVFGISVIDIIAYPEKYINVEQVALETKKKDGRVAILIEVADEDKPQIFEIVSKTINK
jgi:transcriptional regulator with XRE-family HTH domain